MDDFKNDSSMHGFAASGCGRQDKQLNTYDYLAGTPGHDDHCDLVEVQFKNTRKGYYRNDNHIPLVKGDIVAVEASPGHDIGVVSLTGRLVPLQMKKACLKAGTEIKRIYRMAKPVDLEKYEEAKAREHDTMIRSRQIANELGLEMKIGDVEYQGDGNKAIFYYIADNRVDFRKLIKVLADTFHVRIEMKQIGARQEAGRIGGIGPCGRELCCATWMKNFISVSTAAARLQDISLNPQKLAGQCAKLKCCLNYEYATYAEASRKLPSREMPLETQDGTYYFFKADINLRDLPEQLHRAHYFIVTKCPENMAPIDRRILRKVLVQVAYQRVYFTRFESFRPRPLFPEFVDEELNYGQQVIAMSGIGNPGPFVEGLRNNYKVIEDVRFDDHHVYRVKDMKLVANLLAKHPKAAIIMTEKDAVKMSHPEKIPAEVRKRMYFLPINISFIDDSETDFLQKLECDVREN